MDFFERNVGKNCNITVAHSYIGKFQYTDAKVFSGEIVGVDGEFVMLKQKTGTIMINKNYIVLLEIN